MPVALAAKHRHGISEGEKAGKTSRTCTKLLAVHTKDRSAHRLKLCTLKLALQMCSQMLHSRMCQMRWAASSVLMREARIHAQLTSVLLPPGNTCISGSQYL